MAGDWKQRFLRISPRHRDRIARLTGDEFVIYGTRRITRVEVEHGDWSHLGITIDAAGSIALPERWLPEESAGPAARVNRNGEEIIRKDLGLETKYHSVESPNFGDAATYGTHTHDLPYKRYPREFVPPAGTEITMERLASSTDAHADVAFEVDAVFDRTAPDLDGPLLRAMNLLQESVGDVKFRASDEPIATYVHSVGVDWEILPPGQRDDVVRRVVQRLQPNAQDQVILEQRLDFLLGLGPRNLVTGHSGFARYVGAQFADDLVVFENIRYGNAVYIMFEDWQTLSTRSRLELMAGNTDDLVRVVHSDEWEQRVTEVVNEKLGRP